MSKFNLIEINVSKTMQSAEHLVETYKKKVNTIATDLIKIQNFKEHIDTKINFFKRQQEDLGCQVREEIDDFKQ